MKIMPMRIKELSNDVRNRIMKRSMLDISSIYDYVKGLVDDVRERGDKAILESLKDIKGDVTQDELRVKPDEIKDAYKMVSKETVEYLRIAADNIRRFHEEELEKKTWSVEVMEGIIAGRITRPVERVGCYVPGGTASYPSSLLMTVIPAKVAGVKEVVVTTPPQKGMLLNPLVLVAADIAECDMIFKVGGPWAVAGLAFGTETLPKVDKIVGPGNRYVTAAKMIVFGMVDIDSPAGPSEALILVDETAEPEWTAIDFLSQMEHDPDSSAIIVSTSPELAERVCEIVEARFESLPRKAIIESSLSKYSFVLVAEDMDEAVDFANEYAPEHLQIITKEPFVVLQKIRHAGSIFLGPYAPVPVGDYASGTNHVLPTGRGARMFSGLSVDDFIKKPTFQYITKEGLNRLKAVITGLAKEEGLPIHAEAINVRFKK